MTYNCVRCGYETNHKGHFINHLNRKKLVNLYYVILV